MRRQDKLLVIENSEIYLYYKERLINLALAQFEWHGLPETCDRRYFEWSLLYNGKAAMYLPKGLEELGTWLSTDYLNIGDFDIYGYPTDIVGTGYNARQIETDVWEVLYDNMTKTTLLPKIDLYARLLWECHNVFRSNLNQQITPYLVATTKNKSLTFKNFFNQLLGFQPVIEVKNTENIEDVVKTFNLGTQFRGVEMLQALKTLWAEALSMLGISAKTTKKERYIEDEITINRQEDLISLNARLLNRVDFCNKMNRKYGLNLSVNISSQDLSFVPYGDMAMQELAKTDVDEHQASNNNEVKEENDG